MKISYIFAIEILSIKGTFSLSQMSRAKFASAMPWREKIYGNEH